MSEMKVGDVVQLRSGGPRMTVSRLEGDQEVLCVWFVGAEPRFAALGRGALIMAVEPPTGAPKPLRIVGMSLDADDEIAAHTLVQVFRLGADAASLTVANFREGREVAYAWPPVLDWPRENIIAHLAEAGFTVAE